MKNTATTQAFKAFYEHYLSGDQHNNPALIGRWGADPGRFETQVMCHKMGNKIPDSSRYEQDGEIFGPIRWPYDAKGVHGEPHYSDPPIQFIPATRVKAIGTSWWDWRNKHTVGLGFDFDSLIDHAEGIGVSQSEIEKLDNIDVPWLEVIRSTRGNGRHVYIWFQDPFPATANHNEHSALARAFIPLIAEHTGLDIGSNVDCTGMVMWIHHTDATPRNHGYALVKPATQLLTASDAPANWRDGIDVVRTSKASVRTQSADGDVTVQLEESHLRILDALESTGHSSLWVHDYHLWQGHTAGLKQVYDDFAECGQPLKGVFGTNSLDTDPGKPNAFMRPQPGGGWDVYRFGENVEEHPLWDTQGKWTHTTFDAHMPARQVAMGCGAYVIDEQLCGFNDRDEYEVFRLAMRLPDEKTTPIVAADRPHTLIPSPDGSWVVRIPKKPGDDPSTFKRCRKRKSDWDVYLGKLDEAYGEQQEQERAQAQTQEIVRKVRPHSVDDDDKMGTSYLFLMEGRYIEMSRVDLVSALKARGHNKPDTLIGDAVNNSLVEVTVPFQPEYLTGEQMLKFGFANVQADKTYWNRRAPQLRFEPKPGPHPHWDLVRYHAGSGLDEAVANHDWCRKYGIKRGGDYLTLWIAWVLQDPWVRLPALYMVGPQNTGKSMWIEGLDVAILTSGVAEIARALNGSFDGEIGRTLFGTITETKIIQPGKAKDTITGLTVCLRDLYKPQVKVRNLCHLIQMTNEFDSNAAVKKGDTRHTVWSVDRFAGEEIPKAVLLHHLENEGPQFTHTLLTMPIPDVRVGRLNMPVLDTSVKREIMSDGIEDTFDRFIDECCQKSDHPMKAPDLLAAYNEYADKHGYLKRRKFSGKLKLSLDNMGIACQQDSHKCYQVFVDVNTTN